MRLALIGDHMADGMSITIRTFAIVAMASLVSGCVFIPAKSVERRSDQIGDGPKATIRVGETNREAVLGEFGRPSYSTQNNLAFGYLFAVTTGTAKGLLMGPCMPYFGTCEVSDSDDVWLEFDGNGILKRVERRLIAKNNNDTEAAWRQFAKPVPDKIRPEQMLNGQP